MLLCVTRFLFLYCLLYNGFRDILWRGVIIVGDIPLMADAPSAIGCTKNRAKNMIFMVKKSSPTPLKRVVLVNRLVPHRALVIQTPIFGLDSFLD